jgi:hypothetical protein|tara:strand:+ start:12752 stop:13153 length:402 start_codon:yes stop_codon:yes gene_type:complete
MMPKVIDGTWKGEIGRKQIEQWEKENAGKPIDTRTNYEKLMDEKAGVKFTADSVNSPPHYQNGTMETIEIMENQMSVERFLGYLEGSIIKYISRYEYKKNPLEDLKKAEWFLRKLIEKRTQHNAAIELEKHAP